MEYNQFVDDVKNCLRVKVEEEYEVKVNRVKKNNSVVLDGIVFFREGDSISPNIYLNSYYSRYMDGESMEVIANDILAVYEKSRKSVNEEYEGFDYSFESMKDKVIYRLINYNKNAGLLEEVPHIRFLDLAITFHCLVRQDVDGIGTIRITNEHLVEWDLTVKELMKLAEANTRRRFPIKISTMEQVIAELMKKDLAMMCPDEEYKEMMDAMMAEMLSQTSSPRMYIVSNEAGINGATAILYKDAIREFAEKMETDFFILPSSIHEVILVPYDESLSRKELKDMVMEVNSSQVAIEEVLSDKVYVYHRENNRIGL